MEWLRFIVELKYLHFMGKHILVLEENEKHKYDIVAN